jgi:Tfp pilus assembly protein PilN
MVFYKSSLDSSLTAAKEDYNSTLNQLKTGEAKNVLDFQNRINESEKLLKEDVDSKGLLEILEKTMIPGVYLSSYSFVGDTKSLELECMTTSFNSVAQQILSFKNSNLFASVEGGETSFSEQDKAIRFKIVLIPKVIEANLK